jgi:hypothetical protein
MTLDESGIHLQRDSLDVNGWWNRRSDLLDVNIQATQEFLSITDEGIYQGSRRMTKQYVGSSYGVQRYLEY